MLRFVTLGPTGSNHDYVLQRYLAARSTARSQTYFVDDFHAGAAAVVAGEADYLLQCAAHPDFAAVTGRHRPALVPVDAFVAASQNLSLVRAVGARPGGVVAVQPATREYTDLSAFSRTLALPTVSAVQEALLEGVADSGIAFSSFLDKHPGRFECLQDLGCVRDAWVLFGRGAGHAGEPLAGGDAPASRPLA